MATRSRKDAEEIIRSPELFSLLVNAIKEYAVFLLDAGGKVMTWNPGAQRIKGYEPGEIIGKHFSLFYTEEDRARGKPAQTLAIAKESHCEEEGWRVRKNGSKFWASVLVAPIRDAEGRLRGFAKITQDLTARKSAEDERFAKLFNTAHNALSVSTLEDGRFLEANESFCRMTGYTRDEIIGRTAAELGLSGPVAREPIVKLLRQEGRIRNREGRLRHRNGSFREVLLSVELVELGGERCLFSSVEDVTETNQLRATIQALSTPILTVAEQVLVVPLIGFLDEARAAQFREQLLHAIRVQRARCVIIDLTGVACIDALVANTILTTVEAAALLGAQSIISGISTATASTITDLNVSFNRARTTADLRSAIEEALR